MTEENTPKAYCSLVVPGQKRGMKWCGNQAFGHLVFTFYNTKEEKRDNYSWDVVSLTYVERTLGDPTQHTFAVASLSDEVTLEDLVVSFPCKTDPIACLLRGVEMDIEHKKIPYINEKNYQDFIDKTVQQLP